MIGRATYGNPWVLKEIVEHFKGKEFAGPKTLLEKIPTIKKQIELACAFKGERVGMIEMRKHLANYITGIPNAASLRFDLVRVSTKQEALNLLEKITSEL